MLRNFNKKGIAFFIGDTETLHVDNKFHSYHHNTQLEMDHRLKEKCWKVKVLYQKLGKRCLLFNYARFLRHRLVIMLDGPEVQIFYFRKDSEENTKKVNPHPSNNNYFKITYLTFKK